MSGVDVAVLAGAGVAIAGLAWYFFAPRRAHAAAVSDGVQRIQVTIRGGYSPNVVQVRQGIPVEIEFDRQESGDCSSRVVFPDLHLSAALPAHQRTTVRFTPQQAGSFGFACGMNMISGTLVVTPNGQASESSEPEKPKAAAGYAPSDGAGEPAAAEIEAAQAEERHTEIADLTRRVVIGAVLTAPVLYAVMAQPLGPHWVPAVLLNHWLQLALITPVMFYVGWPIHRTGWLALGHRSADMNSLITLGTLAAYGYSLLVTVQNSVSPSQFGVLTPQALQLSRFVGCDSGPRSDINLALAHPLAHRLRAADPEQPGNLTDRRPLRIVLIADLQPSEPRAQAAPADTFSTNHLA